MHLLNELEILLIFTQCNCYLLIHFNAIYPYLKILQVLEVLVQVLLEEEVEEVFLILLKFHA